MKLTTLKRITRSAAIAVLLLLGAGSAAAQQAVILVRHAEKADDSTDTALSEKGRARAQALAALLAKSGVTAIYATEYRRTVQTVQPLAETLGLEVQTIQAKDTAALVERLRSRHQADIVLVVGHSNTVPAVLRALGHVRDEAVADDDFGNVFVLVPRAGQAPSVLTLRY
jgi:broad specificity phosphatase PhoE